MASEGMQAMARKSLKAAAAGAAAAASIGLGAAAASAAVSPAWHSVGRAGVSGTVTALTAVTHIGKTGEWAFVATSNGYPSVYSRSGSQSWAKTTLPGSKAGEAFVAATAISPTHVLAFTRLAGAGGRVWQFNGKNWTVIKTFNAQIGAASVLNGNDVYVFGVIPKPGAGTLGVWHYDGHTWQQIASTLQVGSAVSATNAWAVSGTMVAHFNGTKWTGTNLAKLLPAKTRLNNPHLANVIATSAVTAYAIGTGGTQTTGGPVVVLQYNGHTWSKVAQYSLGAPAPQASTDGHGGLWIPVGGASTPLVMLHYVNGSYRLANVSLPVSATKPGSTINSITRIPGTTQEIAGGSSPNAGGNPPTFADILLYS